MKNSITESIGVDLGDRYSAYCVVDQDTGAELAIPRPGNLFDIQRSSEPGVRSRDGLAGGL